MVDVKVGDRVRLREATVKFVDSIYIFVLIDGDDAKLPVTPAAIAEILPRPFKVGDRVKYQSGVGLTIGATIKAIDGDHAFIQNNGDVYHAIPLTALAHP